MEIVFLKQAQLDIDFWKKSGNKVVQNKISRLLNSIEISPFSGIGKPEPLQHNLTGLWSRRITAEDRLVYEVEKDKIFIYSLKGHYKK